MKKHTVLSPSILLFPLALVLFEFAVYIANDMVQPGMLAVVREFGVSVSWVPTATGAFVLGGVLLPWLTGPLSDHVGRRPVMLCGTVLFILTCLSSLWAYDIGSFMVLRVLQGLGYCFIGAVGYASIQEVFEEKAAVKVMALMSNVAMIAPLIGPVVGAVVVHIWSWRATFVAVAAIATVSFIGLFFSMPETVVRHEQPRLSLGKLARDYREVFSNLHFVAAALCIPLVSLPLLGWVGLSPLFLVKDAGMTTLQYGWWQLPVIGALLVGNLVLVKVADHWPLGHSVAVARVPTLAGIVIMLAGGLFPSVKFYFMIAGMCLITFSQGLSFSVLYRFALTASGVAKGAVSAGLTMLTMLVYAGGLEVLKHVYLTWGYTAYALLILAVMLVFFFLSSRVARVAMADRASGRLAEDEAA